MPFRWCSLFGSHYWIVLGAPSAVAASVGRRNGPEPGFHRLPSRWQAETRSCEWCEFGEFCAEHHQTPDGVNTYAQVGMCGAVLLFVCVNGLFRHPVLQLMRENV